MKGQASGTDAVQTSKRLDFPTLPSRLTPVIKIGFFSLVCAFAFCLQTPSLRAQTPAAPTATPLATPRVDQAKYGVYPIAFRELVMRYLEKQLLDAGSAKIEWLGDPQPIEMKGSDNEMFLGYVVDFKVNSRNMFGTYTGMQTRRVYIRDGEVVGGGRK